MLLHIRAAAGVQFGRLRPVCRRRAEEMCKRTIRAMQLLLQACNYSELASNLQAELQLQLWLYLSPWLARAVDVDISRESTQEPGCFRVTETGSQDNTGGTNAASSFKLVLQFRGCVPSCGAIEHRAPSRHPWPPETSTQKSVFRTQTQTQRDSHAP